MSTHSFPPRRSINSTLSSAVACTVLATLVNACTVVRDVPKTGLPAENQIHVLKRDLFFGRMFFRDREPEIFPPWSEPGYARATRFGEWNNQTRQTIDLLPSSIAEYRINPGKWPRVIGVVPTGTRFKLARVTVEQEFEYHAYYYYGEFLDGPYAGKTVLLNDIWPRAGEYIDSKDQN